MDRTLPCRLLRRPLSPSPSGSFPLPSNRRSIQRTSTVLSDAQLLAAIRTDLARSPFQGEGHRKVHARLRILDGVRVARTRGVARDARARAALASPRTTG